jgi:hypothetical protein
LSELGPIDFSYRAICCHVFIEKSENRDVLFFIEQRAHEQNVAFELDGPSGRLHISSDIIEAISEEARARPPAA